MDFLHTTEFYVMLFVAAASAVAFMAKPKGGGPVAEHLLAGHLGHDSDERPRVAVVCGDDGIVTLTRSGLSGITSSGAVSLKVEVKGFSLMVSERLTPGNPSDEPMEQAVFVLDFLASERYSLRYESDGTSSAASFSFRNVAGYRAERELKN